jgi:hypothetical protein
MYLRKCAAQDRTCWRAAVNTAMNLWFHEGGESIEKMSNCLLLKKTSLRGVTLFIVTRATSWIPLPPPNLRPDWLAVRILLLAKA